MTKNIEFKKYQHLERFGTTEVQNIELGETYVFPKIDGTNASVWIVDGEVKAGSRTRELTLDKDNGGFYEWVLQQEKIKEYLLQNQTHILYGEWLIPHSLKTYRQEAWRNFYVFDVMERETEIHIHYSIYSELLKPFNINYIPPISIIKNGSYEQFIDKLSANVFLIEDGKGAGEGIVIKRYDYVNRYGRQTWAKIVTSEFKEKHHKEMGAPLTMGGKIVEEEIVNEFLTLALVEKEKAKIELDNNGFFSKNIPQLLNTVFYNLVKEESWNFIKKHRNPTIDYKRLQFFAFKKVRELQPQLF